MVQQAKAPSSGATVRGWCPTAWRPMMAGDGLLVRVRPPLGRMNRDQALGLCEAARRHGNGHIDLTNRAALQIRGVAERDHADLTARLVALGLVHADPVREARGNMLLTPDWMPGDETQAIALSLTARLGDLPDLPAKMGFAIDTGIAPALRDISADFRFERSAGGALLLRADGRVLGAPVTVDSAADALIALARWFVTSGGAASGRMARHRAALPQAPGLAPASSRPPARLLDHAPGRFHGAPFGRMEADELAALLEEEGVTGLRLTPWRGVLVEGGSVPPRHDLGHPLLRIDACPGAPACPQSSVATRDLAAALAPHVRGTLHVSGCAKGCARPAPADIVLTGRDGLFDLTRSARAGTPPVEPGLTPDRALALLGAC